MDEAEATMAGADTRPTAISIRVEFCGAAHDGGVTAFCPQLSCSGSGATLDEALSELCEDADVLALRHLWADENLDPIAWRVKVALCAIGEEQLSIRRVPAPMPAMFWFTAAGFVAFSFGVMFGALL
jgi:hypothetical protein